MEKRLGKGLDALISENVEDVSKPKEKIETLKLAEIVPNQFQPRKRFTIEKMEELVSSIKEKGVIQPILVREADGVYELVAGERRWRAAQKLELDEIPAIIRNDIDDVASLEISLIENIQREELNPVEEAMAYQELVSKFGYTLEKVGQMVGKDKTTVSNSLRLLSLSGEIRTLLEEGKISTGHAKVLLSVPSEHKRKKIVATILRQGTSVREAEQLVRRVADLRKKPSKAKDPDILQVEESLQHMLGTKVNIRQGKKRGRIEIQYFSNEDLQRLLGLILK